MDPHERISFWLIHIQPWDFINAVNQFNTQEQLDVSQKEVFQNPLEATSFSSDKKAKVQNAYKIIHRHIKNNQKFWNATHADTLNSLAQRIIVVGDSLHLKYSKLEKLQYLIQNVRTKNPPSGNTLRPTVLATEDQDSPITPSDTLKFLGPFYQIHDDESSKKQPEKQPSHRAYATECKVAEPSEIQMPEAVILEKARKKLQEIQAKIQKPDEINISETTAYDLLKNNPKRCFIAWEKSSAPGNFAFLIAGAQEICVTDANRFLHLMEHYEKYKCTPPEFKAYIKRYYLSTLK